MTGRPKVAKISKDPRRFDQTPDAVEKRFEALFSTVALLAGVQVVSATGNAQMAATYVRLEDGTMLAWTLLTDAEEEPQWAFPSAFIAPPSVVATIQTSDNLDHLLVLNTLEITKTQATFRRNYINMPDGTYGASTAGDISAFAVGRWK